MLRRFVSILLYKIFIGILVFLSFPLLIIISVLIFLIHGRPIFYLQRRVGKNNTEFVLYKFRTMTQNADKIKYQYTSLNEAKGPTFKIRNDPRFTSVGKFLSHTGLDELPQLINIFRSEMSLIGPRPLPVNEAKKLKPWMQERHTIKPGIISPWVLDGYHSKTFDEWMKSDVMYTHNKNTLYDLSLSLKAVILIVSLLVREVQNFQKTARDRKNSFLVTPSDLPGRAKRQ